MNKKEKQKVLVIGSGGREHAIGWKLKQSTHEPELFFAPGNAGTLKLGTNVNIKSTDINALLDFAKREKIDLTLAIPDDPLALGIVNLFQKENLRIFGPTKNAAMLESSKAFSKEFMHKYDLPTADFKIFTDFNKAKDYVENQRFPIVVKASGLALGKGVIIAEDKEQAIKALEEILIDKVFGEAGSEVVVEDFLEGVEISTHAFADGETYSFFPTSQDHKKIGENDTGLNTGGMGTIAPLPFVEQDLIDEIKKTVVEPTLSNMKKEGEPYSGVLYPGLILTEKGPKILEFNARFGDPETQTYMRLLETDLLEIINKIVDGKLADIKIKWKQLFACTVILASGGYPVKYEKGKIIEGVDNAEEDGDVVVFQAGTKIDNGDLVTDGGRVLGVSATGDSLETALDKAYKAIKKITFDGMYYRKDIGKKAISL